MVGCRVGAKNTLVKNYLWFAEKKGVEIIADCEVADIRPLGAADGSQGYDVETARPGAWLRTRRRTLTARGVVVAAGALGTNRLLAGCKLRGSLPAISDRLGHLVRTNSESLLAVTLPDDRLAPWNDVAISASIHPRPRHAHRVRHLRTPRRLHVGARHAPHRRGHAPHAPAHAARQHRAPPDPLR